MPETVQTQRETISGKKYGKNKEVESKRKLSVQEWCEYHSSVSACWRCCHLGLTPL